MKLRLLDLYCGAGGASVGYARAGFDVHGIDINPQKNYPFEYSICDVADIDVEYIKENYDVIHASPPCQRYSSSTPASHRYNHPDLIPLTRKLLKATGLPYVIENVEGAPLLGYQVRLCGSSFNLDIRRHRYFETNIKLRGKPCDHGWQTPRFPPSRQALKKNPNAPMTRVFNVVGGGDGAGSEGLVAWQRAMGIDWMSRRELTQSIPPAYTEYLGKQILEQLAMPGDLKGYLRAND